MTAPILGLIAAASFFIGMFPNRYFRIIGSFIDGKIFKNFSRDIPLEKFTGINSNEATRLWEEGIDNVDQLADISVQDLYKRTKLDPNRLTGLIGRALLWKYVFGIENMIIKLGIIESEPKDEILISKIKEIESFPFCDIQGLCMYIFEIPLEKIDISDIIEKGIEVPNLIKQKFPNHTNSKYITHQLLQEIAFMVSYFQHQLFFKQTEQEIRELLNEEFPKRNKPNG